jgi:uncharacterized SAM-binding protein YcdF (DUF218 family)
MLESAWTIAVLFLNKILPLLVLPLGFSLFLLLIGLTKKRYSFIEAALVLLYACSMPWVADHLEAWLEAKYPPIPVEQAESADAIVMLSGIFGPPVTDGYVLNVGEASERLEGSIQLWQHHKAPRLVFTGGRTPWETKQALEGDVSTRVAVGRGIPADHIIVTHEVGNTADEAKAVAELVRERGWKKVLLVTSANHMRRAAIQFRDASVEFVPFAVDYCVDPKRKTNLLDFLPSARSLAVTENVVREAYGSVFYAMLRWLH